MGRKCGTPGAPLLYDMLRAAAAAAAVLKPPFTETIFPRTYARTYHMLPNRALCLSQPCGGRRRPGSFFSFKLALRIIEGLHLPGTSVPPFETASDNDKM